MISVYAVKDLETGLYISEVAGCIFARRKYENYVYELKAAKQVMQDAQSKSQVLNYGFTYDNLAVVPVELFTVPFISRSIDVSWSTKVKQGIPFDEAVKGSALEHVRLYGSIIRKRSKSTISILSAVEVCYSVFLIFSALKQEF